jgi:hypothetical protein
MSASVRKQIVDGSPQAVRPALWSTFVELAARKSARPYGSAWWIAADTMGAIIL